MPKTTFGSFVMSEKNLKRRSGGFRGLIQAIYSLEELPERCPLIPEHEEFSFEIRHLIYFSHRIVFRVELETKRVVIYRVYHGSREALAEADMP
jgi:plasmid stabilization system protein ParE